MYTLLNQSDPALDKSSNAKGLFDGLTFATASRDTEVKKLIYKHGGQFSNIVTKKVR